MYLVLYVSIWLYLLQQTVSLEDLVEVAGQLLARELPDNGVPAGS